MTYKQQHPETCLATCLLIALRQQGIPLKRASELDILTFALRFNRESFILGHLQKIVEDCGVVIRWLVDTEIYYSVAKQQQFSSRINLLKEKINLRAIDRLLEKPLILSVDLFPLWEPSQGLYYRYHYPHFILVLEKRENRYRIIDPNIGKQRWLDSKRLAKAISSLRNRLWMSPHLIQIKS